MALDIEARIKRLLDQLETAETDREIGLVQKKIEALQAVKALQS